MRSFAGIFLCAVGILASGVSSAKTIKIEYLDATIEPENVRLLGDLACREIDKIVHLKIAIDLPDRKRDQETNGYQRLVFWDDDAEYLFPKDTYQWLHGEYVIDGYFIVRSGGIHQGQVSNAFEKVGDAQILLNPNVKEVPAKAKGC